MKVRNLFTERICLSCKHFECQDIKKGAFLLFTLLISSVAR